MTEQTKRGKKLSSISGEWGDDASCDLTDSCKRQGEEKIFKGRRRRKMERGLFKGEFAVGD
jgi:hypothetical protein